MASVGYGLIGSLYLIMIAILNKMKKIQFEVKYSVKIQ